MHSREFTDIPMLEAYSRPASSKGADNRRLTETGADFSETIGVGITCCFDWFLFFAMALFTSFDINLMVN
jgi:hypothetical protein